MPSGEEKALAKLNISGKIPEASVQSARQTDPET